ncbi:MULTISPECIES: hypothetical protein [Helicobacter]|uniref:hypothetical protein n=1 Tax=Helicobacter TaxID=209 RepID=UPI002601D358|nr:hypothetical protein [Helicobacter sp. UBA3407]
MLKIIKYATFAIWIIGGIVQVVLSILWLIIVVTNFINEPFINALWDNIKVTILFAIPVVIFWLILWLLASFLSKVTEAKEGNFLHQMEQLNALFENSELPNERDLFSKYIQYTELENQKESLSFVQKIDFSTLQYTSNNPIMQDLFKTLTESLNASCKYDGTIYELLTRIKEKEDLFSNNLTDKAEIAKIAWYFRDFIKIQLAEEKEDDRLFVIPDDEWDKKNEEIWACIHALNDYSDALKMLQTINEVCFYDIKKGLPKIVEFCKQGKWDEFVKNMNTEDIENLEMMILKVVFEDSLEWHKWDSKMDSKTEKIIGDRILTAFTFKDLFKSYKAQYFFEVLPIYLQEKEKIKSEFVRKP